MSDHKFAIRDARLLLDAVSEISIPQPADRLNWLLSLAECATGKRQGESGRLVAIAGEPGAGKTRLAFLSALLLFGSEHPVSWRSPSELRNDCARAVAGALRAKKRLLVFDDWDAGRADPSVIAYLTCRKFHSRELGRVAADEFEPSVFVWATSTLHRLNEMPSGLRRRTVFIHLREPARSAKAGSHAASLASLKGLKEGHDALTRLVDGRNWGAICRACEAAAGC